MNQQIKELTAFNWRDGVSGNYHTVILRKINGKTHTKEFTSETIKGIIELMAEIGLAPVGKWTKKSFKLQSFF